LTESLLKAVRRPEGLETMTVTFPPNPFSAATVIVELPIAPVSSEMKVGLPEREKSTAVMMKVEVWTKPPLVPVTVTGYVDAAVGPHDMVAVPFPVILAGEIGSQLRFDGVAPDRTTVPLNP